MEEIAKENRTVLCFGIDPDISKLNIDVVDISGHYQDMVDMLLDEKEISAIKPNYAFFAQYGFEGLYNLENIIQHYRGKIPVILDAKRGDIGKTGLAYAKEVYDFWQADAVTLHPYMGHDSVEPFLREGKIAYIQCRNSNPGAKDFQELACGDELLYEKVARKAVEWKCGIVVGATSDAIKRIVKITENRVPMLIPGIGAQGGDLEMVMEAIKPNPYIHRINASSSIAFAKDPLAEARKLNAVIRKYL